jgi:hypothetical protein
MDEESNGVKPEWKISDALKTAWSAYKNFSRSVRLHINTWTFFLLYVIASRIFGSASTRIVIFLAILSWLAAIYMDLEVLYRRVYRTLIGKAFLAIGFVAATIMAHAISSIVVNSVTGVDPSKFPYTVTLLSLMCVPFFVLSASIPLFVLLLIFAPVAFLFLTQDRGAINFIIGKDVSGQKKPLIRTSIAITLISWMAFTGFAYQIEQLYVSRYDVAMSDLAKYFIFNFETYGHSQCKVGVNEKVGFISESEILVARKQDNAVTFTEEPCVKRLDSKTAAANIASNH